MITAVLALLATHKNPLVGVWEYRALSDKGVVIASGKITLHEITAALRKKERLAPNYVVIGEKKITCVDPAKYGPHAGQDFPGLSPKLAKRFPTEQVIGELENNVVRFDLNFHWNDNNIRLDGTLDRSGITGTWGWGTFAGYRTKGTFRMVKV